MDFQSMMETFAEAWVAANTQTPLTEAAAAAAAAAAANDHANLFMGLGAAATNSGTGNGSPLILDTESRGIRTTTGSNSASSVNIAPQSSSSTTISSSANQSSPGLNLLSHHLHHPIHQQKHHQHGTSPTTTSTTMTTSTTNNPDTSAVACDESLTAAFGQAAVAAAASQLLDIKDVIGTSNGGSCDQQLNARNTLPIHCIIERMNSTISANGSSGPQQQQQQQQITGSCHQQSTSSSSSTPPPLNVNISNQSNTNDLSQMTNHPSSTNTSGISVAASNSPTTAGIISNSPPSSSTTLAFGNLIEQDTYAILPSTIPYADIIRAVLTKLGYASQEMVGAKAFIQIRNWKPLTLDQISDLTNSEITIGDLFGDICSFITLRIRLCRPRMSAAHELKDKLLQVLLAHSYNLLTTNNSGSSIDQQILSSLIRGRDQQQQQQLELNEDARRRFDQWYLQQVFNQYRQFALAAQQHSVSVSGLRSGNPSPGAASTAAAAANHPLFMDINNLTNGTDSTLAAAAAGLHPSLAAAAAAAAVRPSPVNGNIVGPSSNSCSSQEKPFGHSKNSSGNHNSHSSHHHSSGTSSRTRIRTSFDPELELPKLHKWFAENRHPSRSQVQEYVKELNSLESRKGRKPLDVNNVVYWFKNARAAHKRAELKFVSNDSNLSNHSFANALATEFFLNGGGNHSPGKASSDASASGKCNDDPMSNASRNGSNLDDYYSFDEDNDSHEETQTLDLSVRNPLCMSTKLSDSPHQPIEDKMLDDGDDCDDFKFVDDLKRHDLSDVSDLRLEPDVQLKIESRDYGGSAVSGNGSDCNSIEDESDDDTETTHNNNNNCSHNNSLTSHSLTSSLSALNHNSGHSSHNPESPEGRRTRRSRTFIDPMSEVPRLESWFMSNTHPAHSQIVRYTDELNKMPYRQKFPKLEPKNIQFWFKNRRAKFKRTSGMNTVTMNLSSNSAIVTSASASNASGTSPSLSNASIHNSSALNIERLINAH